MYRLLTLFVLGALLAGCTSSTPTASTDAAELSGRQLDLGMGYLRIGDYPRAREKLNKALMFDPRSAPVHAAFGLLFQLEGEHELAEEHFRKALRYDADNAQVRNGYGVFLFSMQRYPEAVKQLKKASENPFYVNRPSVFENLGVAHARVGDIEQAEGSFARAIRLNPEQSRALLKLAEIRFDQRNYLASQDLYNRHTRVSEETPESLWLCIRLADVFDNRDDKAGCVQALESVHPASQEYGKYSQYKQHGKYDENSEYR